MSQTVKLEDDFAMGMASIKTSAMLLGITDWQGFLDQAAFAEGAGAVLNPGLFMDIHRDKTWPIKVRLAKAAHAFVAEFRACEAEVLALPEKAA